MKKLISIATLALLAACSGGSHGGTLPPTPVPTNAPTTAPKKVSHLAIKASGNATAQGTVHRQAMSARPQDLTGIVPTFLGDFAIADFATSLDNHAATSASAYYDTSANPAPSPLPTVTWSQTGANDTVTPIGNPVNNGTVIYVGSVSVSAGSGVGSTTVTATASNGDSATATGITYRGTALGDQNSTTDPRGLTFDANGSHPQTSGGDITINSSGDVTVVSAPGGVVLVPKPIDKVQAGDYKNPSPSVSANICAGPSTLVFSTPNGLVKWMPATYVWPSGTCKWTNAYGPYQLAVGGSFAQ
jgi:hypothetical protein